MLKYRIEGLNKDFNSTKIWTGIAIDKISVGEGWRNNKVK